MIKKFSFFSSADERYDYLIELGRSLPSFSRDWMIEEKKVGGCQSTLYLHATHDPLSGQISFFAESDALISKGLAALLIAIYSEETPEKILTTPPTFLHDIKIFTSLSPHRSNGLLQIHLRMKKEAIKIINR